MADPILVAKNENDLFLLPKMANRHGLVAGATGTGKTVTIHAMADHFSKIGVPVFLADVKGDLAGMCQPGGGNSKVEERVKSLGLTDWSPEPTPTIFWDLYGQQGHPIRTTVSEMGPLLLARLLGLNETQAGVLQLVFKYADDNNLLLLDLKDLQSMLQYVGEQAKTITTAYGNVSPASIGAIQRGLLALETNGGDVIFGEPALKLQDFMRIAPNGRGFVSILAADKLMQSPTAYATFLLWLMSELYEELPEVGDLDKPKLVFFFDEAHLLFTDLPSSLQDKIEQVVRLIRSKGVGIYFVSQNPLDIPDIVLGQLGNRVQHALRAFTPRDQKAVKAAAQTFRINPDLNVEDAITQLEVGEALVSLLDEKGAPGVVQRAYVVPPESMIGTITPEQRLKVINWSPVQGVYDAPIDRESAYEILKAKAERSAQAAAAAEQAKTQAKADAAAAKEAAAQAKALEKAQRAQTRSSSRSRRSTIDTPEEFISAVTDQAIRQTTRSVGNSLSRSILGTLRKAF
jgi:DNA helicase HerA-like ATPase